ncbi:aldo/keto reductase [uncultured Paludibaculum sp.]|uniref:aldo/keto reductase n=1 Tax=uncultured Paludibaculum sp. TaxID=1765020 RepID=UPI002AAAE362|nr:aldo/keto reductase [uncultured Paludibaculum sp.]
MNLSRRGFLAAGAISPALLAAPGAPPPAPIRTLGRTGLKVTSVGFGCMVTSDPTVIERAVDQGITYFDTARVYSGGNNERMVGTALKPHRQKLVITSKTIARDKEGALRDIDTTLKELGTDHIDIWYLHAKDRADQITPDLLEAQQIAKKQGKIRFAGLSLHNGHAEVIPAAIKTGSIDVILTTYNFAMAQTMEPLVKSISDAGIGVVAMKVMAGSMRLDRSYDYDRAKAAMAKPGAALSALKWALRMPYIHTAIPSIKDNEQLEENLKALREPYQSADAKLLAAHLDRITPLYCRMCGTCAGACPQGLPVSDMLRYLTYADGYGEFALARDNFQTMPAELQQVRCESCDHCTIQCPNGVRVRERLIRTQELLA